MRSRTPLWSWPSSPALERYGLRCDRGGTDELLRPEVDREALQSHAGRPLFGPPFLSSSSLGWLRRHASLSSSKRRFLSSRRRSAASLAFLRSRSRSLRRTVTPHAS